ncbi:unnamed protein product [Cuscuta campestris]|uniref:Uncharacterized protein n=1 Tax=Cuscuta campestris TaxID=132261 RepID=A0A484LRG8_9ASTE|nr:unnamed protein product [Cuscuta campestris]
MMRLLWTSLRLRSDRVLFEETRLNSLKMRAARLRRRLQPRIDAYNHALDAVLLAVAQHMDQAALHPLLHARGQARERLQACIRALERVEGSITRCEEVLQGLRQIIGAMLDFFSNVDSTRGHPITVRFSVDITILGWLKQHRAENKRFFFTLGRSITGQNLLSMREMARQIGMEELDYQSAYELRGSRFRRFHGNYVYRFVAVLLIPSHQIDEEEEEDDGGGGGGWVM